MDERARRVGQNEALFREVNERVREVNETFGVALEGADFVCECGDRDCIDRVSVPLGDYERVRGDGATFVVKPGHVFADVEDVVEEHKSFAVVRKHGGGPATLAREEDPRS